MYIYIYIYIYIYRKTAAIPSPAVGDEATRELASCCGLFISALK